MPKISSRVATSVMNFANCKAGGLVAKTKQEGSVAFALMGMAARAKRGVVKEAKNGGVINVTPEEGVESLNLQNVDGALNFARDNIIYDIASGSDVPAILPNVDPSNKAILVDWLASVVNGTQTYGDQPLIIDAEALAEYVPPQPLGALNGSEEEEEA